MLKVLDCWKKISYVNRNISMCYILRNDNKSPKRKVKETVELITLVDQNDKILGLKPKMESIRLAKKLNFTLERVNDTKYGKTYPAYKMFSAADLLKEEKKLPTANVLKKLALNSRISNHDLGLKANIIKRWLSKDNYEVHIAILRNNEQEATMKNVLAQLQEQLKDDARLLNIRQNEEAIKFIVLPPKKSPKKSTSKNSNDKIESSKEDS